MKLLPYLAGVIITIMHLAANGDVISCVGIALILLVVSRCGWHRFQAWQDKRERARLLHHPARRR